MDPFKRASNQPVITPAWISDPVMDDPVILSTRLRLARNLDHYPFPHIASDTVLREVTLAVGLATQDRRVKSFRSLRSVDISGSSDADKAALVDSHLVSLLHVTSGQHRVALIDEKHTVSIMINEEDHIRIQAILPGLMPDTAWQDADRLDDALSQRLPIAYHNVYGLPALVLDDQITQIIKAVNKIGLAVRGLYGEGGEQHGDVYQFSNSTSVGQTERQILGRLKSVAMFLESEEESARHVIRSVRMNDVLSMADLAQERLKHATALTAADAMSLLSTLRLAEMLGIKTYVSHRMFCEMLASMRGSIGSIANKKNRARDVFYEDTRRPALLRNRLRQERAGVHFTARPL